MHSSAHHDPASLASLARTGDRELRPVLLLVQARAFKAAAATADRRAASSFEALALGLIPLVTDDVVADVIAILADARNVPERVRQLLLERRRARSLGAQQALLAGAEAPDRRDLPALAESEDPPGDITQAEDGSVTLDGHALATLVERARRDAALARALLARPEPTAFDRAALYRFADEPARARIRQELERPLAVASPPRPLLPPETRQRLLDLANAARYAPLRSMLGKFLAISPAPRWRLKEPAEAELFALALVAAGLSVEDCLRVLLTADRTLGRSVTDVFRLASLCRTAPPAVAWRLVDAGTAATRARTIRPRPVEGGTPRARRARAGVASIEPAASTAAPRPGSAPADRRSRSTIGRDRT